MEDFERLKTIELNMLKEFIAICNKHNLRYFVLGGTCLGAIRHKGFIPWDDDIDVGMPRKDYNEFLRVAQGELSNGLFLQNGKTDPNFPLNFTKIRNSNTTFIESTMKNIDMNHGVYIDIFPLDGYKKSIFRKIKRKICGGKIGMVYGDRPKQTIKRKIKNLMINIFNKDYKTARDKLDAMYAKFDFDKSETVVNYCGAWGDKEIVPRSVFGSGVEKDFEDLKVIAPENYDEYLTKMYGNYMEFPPIEKRVARHDTEIIDLDKPYGYYKKLRSLES